MTSRPVRRAFGTALGPAAVVLLAAAVVLAGVPLPATGSASPAASQVSSPPASDPANQAGSQWANPVASQWANPAASLSANPVVRQSAGPPVGEPTSELDSEPIEPGVEGGGQHGDPTNETAACPPGSGRADPETDRLGWEAGCWAGQSLRIDHADGLNETELARLTARTMARIEVIRGLEFTDPVTVDVVPRSTLENGGGNRTIPTARRLRENVKYEALFMVPETEDVLGGAGGGGGAPSFRAFYAPWDERVVIITDGTTTDRVYEPLLAHELVHALQDDHFDGDRPRGLDARRAKSALVEGEAAVVVSQYRQRCRGQWAGECLLPPDDGEEAKPSADRWCGATDPRFNWGRHLFNLFAYSDGPVFVHTLYDRGGWEAVDAAHRHPPDSTAAVVNPARYGTDPPRNVSLADTSGDGWTVVEPARSRNPTGFTLGQSALYAMLWSQWFATDHRVEIIPCADAFETTHPLDKFDYAHPVVDGLVGDRLVPYRMAGSDDIARTGYVWKTVWERPADAREFAAAYRTMLRGHNATAVPGRPDTFGLPEESGYGDAFYVAVRGETVLVVNAPTVDDLAAIRPGIQTDPTPSISSTRTPAATGTPTGVAADPEAGEPTASGVRTGLPGFGPGGALLALAAVLVAVVLHNRRRTD